MVIIHYVVIGVCLFLSSCSKHQSQQKNNVDELLSNEQKKKYDIIVQQEAMLVDVPIPLYDERIISSFDFTPETDTLVFGYKSPLSCAQVIEFFMNQMERYGWQHLVSFNSTESLLQFSSPNRYCTVIIRNADYDVAHSYVFIYIKKSET